jgi:hypothetical protein
VANLNSGAADEQTDGRRSLISTVHDLKAYDQPRS